MHLSRKYSDPACLSLHCAMKGVLAQTRKVRVFTVLEGATTTLWLLVQPKYASFNVCSIVFCLAFYKMESGMSALGFRTTKTFINLI